MHYELQISHEITRNQWLHTHMCMTQIFTKACSVDNFFHAHWNRPYFSVFRIDICMRPLVLPTQESDLLSSHQHSSTVNVDRDV